MTIKQLIYELQKLQPESPVNALVFGPTDGGGVPVRRILMSVDVKIQLEQGVCLLCSRDDVG